MIVVYYGQDDVGQYGKDVQGNVWVPFSLMGEDAMYACAECGAPLASGWARGMVGEQTYYCATHITYQPCPIIHVKHYARDGYYIVEHEDALYADTFGISEKFYDHEYYPLYVKEQESGLYILERELILPPRDVNKGFGG